MYVVRFNILFVNSIVGALSDKINTNFASPQKTPPNNKQKLQTKQKQKNVCCVRVCVYIYIYCLFVEYPPLKMF